MKSPCYECKDRVLYCHCNCTRYSDFLKDYEKTKTAVKNKTSIDSAIKELSYSRVNRALKRRNTEKK